MKNGTLKEMNEQFKDCPMHSHEYEIDGTKFIVHSHFVGEKDINDVMLRYAENRAIGEMLGRIPQTNTVNIK